MDASGFRTNAITLIFIHKSLQWSSPGGDPCHVRLYKDNYGQAHSIRAGDILGLCAWFLKRGALLFYKIKLKIFLTY